MRFQILVYDGFDELDGIAPYEVLQNTSSLFTEIIVELVSLNFPEEIVAAHGLRIFPSAKLNSEKSPDLLIVPGGGWVAHASKGSRAEVKRGVIPATLKALHDKGTIMASVCTGAMLLAASGILRGRRAVTHHAAMKDLQEAGAEIIRSRIVDDDDIITSGGVTSGLDLALWLVERFFGVEAADQIGARMEYERRGEIWRRNT